MSSSLKQAMPTGKAHMALTMAGISAGSGVYAFAKSRSVPSLVAGLGLAAAYGYAAHLISTGDCTEGHALAAGTSAVLSVVMLRRSVGTPGWLNLPTIVSPIAVGDTAYEAMRAKQWYDAEQDDGEEDGSEHSGDRT